MSEWLLNGKWAIFQVYHGENKLHSMRWCSCCNLPTRLVGFLVLADWNNSLLVDMLLLLDTLSLKQQSAGRHVTPLGHIILFQPTLFLLLNAVYLAEQQQIPILSTLPWPDQCSNSQSTALDVSMLTITPPMRFLLIGIFFVFLLKIFTFECNANDKRYGVIIFFMIIKHLKC